MSRLAYIRKDLFLKLEALLGFEISAEDIYEHDLGYWAGAIGRQWVMDAFRDETGLYFRLEKLDNIARQTDQTHGWGPKYVARANPVRVSVPMFRVWPPEGV